MASRARRHLKAYSSDGTMTYLVMLSTEYNTTAFPDTYSISCTKDESAYGGAQGPRMAGAQGGGRLHRLRHGWGGGRRGDRQCGLRDCPAGGETTGAVALSGSGHVQTYGDVAAKASGKGVVLGTTGESRRLEQFSLALPKDGQRRHRVPRARAGRGLGGGRHPCGTTGKPRESGSRRKAPHRDDNGAAVAPVPILRTSDHELQFGQAQRCLPLLLVVLTHQPLYLARVGGAIFDFVRSELELNERIAAILKVQNAIGLEVVIPITWAASRTGASRSSTQASSSWETGRTSLPCRA